MENKNKKSSFLGYSEQPTNLLNKSVFYVLLQLLFKVIYGCQHDERHTREIYLWPSETSTF
jgi:hypothetical protein